MQSPVAAFVKRLRDLGRISAAISAARELRPSAQRYSIVTVRPSMANDPVGAGLVASLARPDGNVTGLSVAQTDVAGKRTRTVARGCFRSPPFGDYG
jgi:putative ABC transport system substrate-binding protein